MLVARNVFVLVGSGFDASTRSDAFWVRSLVFSFSRRESQREDGSRK